MRAATGPVGFAWRGQAWEHAAEKRGKINIKMDAEEPARGEEINY